MSMVNLFLSMFLVCYVNNLNIVIAWLIHFCIIVRVMHNKCLSTNVNGALFRGIKENSS